MKLTPRELEIVRLLARGLTNKQIAAALAISDFTVRDHLTRVFRKAQVSSRLELITRLPLHL
ncbi:MAG TPA: LuxR C-terminal-related transcriptional regulator [Pseudomonas sp.]|uniref:response regulator transcription factor n=1 Tax=Pseudomonas sp. TaxID=306 RepID=UPI002B47462E|nr:LuxR C-terminal-related transcriptional regulator [Pseudomonas sp.]HKS13523.1 LuxR C-terminal-related transcriptional regulator [Pseudomonas sp.]